jgi:chromosomal replication initiation ATPase DnaA
MPDHERLARTMLPVAAALAVAVDEEDAVAIAELITTLSRQQINALAVVLAAHVDPDKPLIRASVVGVTKKAARLSADAFSVDLVQVMGQSRRLEFIDARVVTYYAANLAGESYSQIGRIMQRDHSTVMSGCARVQQNGRLRRVAEQIATELGWNREADTA